MVSLASLLLLWSGLSFLGVSAFVPTILRTCLSNSQRRLATLAESDAPSSARNDESDENAQTILTRMQQLKEESIQYADSFGLSPSQEGAFFALFSAIQQEDFVRQKIPFVLRHEKVQSIWNDPVEWPGFFSMEHLEKALEDDFLDAARGSTDNRKGWTITDVSVPRGDSFEEARMTYKDVQTALEKGTVIFNAAGAHIPRLAGPNLASCDATWLPCALNLYITDAGKRTSAPPHTDKQDVVVIQSTGCKHWRVYSPPNPADKPSAEMFARGKMEDSLPLYSLETDLGCQLLLETTLYPGDCLFVPAAFPHTTSTVHSEDDDHPATKDISVHLTMGFDHHIWELDYLSVRRLALRRAGVKDTALGKFNDGENPYVGAANELPAEIRNVLFSELPLGLLQDDDEIVGPMIEEVTSEVQRLAHAIDETTASKVPTEIWKETVERVRQQGMELHDIHRDMYLAALEEGRAREAEEAMTAHLGKQKKAMTPERMQRLSLFRVKRYFDEIEVSKNALRDWSFAGTQEGAGSTGLPADWAFTLPVKVNDSVEADLGGAFFAAKVTRASGGTYDVQFFDGDRETGLQRSQIKLTTPPAAEEDEIDTSHMTPKELKRWRKQQEKRKNK